MIRFTKSTLRKLSHSIFWMCRKNRNLTTVSSKEKWLAQWKEKESSLSFIRSPHKGSEGKNVDSLPTMWTCVHVPHGLKYTVNMPYTLRFSLPACLQVCCFGKMFVCLTNSSELAWPPFWRAHHSHERFPVKWTYTTFHKHFCRMSLKPGVPKIFFLMNRMFWVRISDFYLDSWRMLRCLGTRGSGNHAGGWGDY